MKPKILCSECSNELHQGDKFCGKCGAKVEDAAGSSKAAELILERPASPSASPVASNRCRLCGHENPREAITCESCGAPTQTVAAKTSAQDSSSAGKAGPVPFTFLTSWRLTVTLAVILIAAVVTLKLTKGSEAPVEKSDVAAAPAAGTGIPAQAMQEIEALEKAVADKPDDAPAWLRLANMLQDGKMYAKALASYDKYIALKPDDPDARVDQGVTYYDYAVADSTKRTENLALAKKNFELALTQNPQHQLAMFNLGIVSLQNGDMPGANGWFEKCAAVDTSTDTGKKAEMMIHQHTFSQQ